METYVRLAQHAAESLDDLGHSALPHAPIRPYHPRPSLRRWLRDRRRTAATLGPRGVRPDDHEPTRTPRRRPSSGTAWLRWHG